MTKKVLLPVIFGVVACIACIGAVLAVRASNGSIAPVQSDEPGSAANAAQQSTYMFSQVTAEEPTAAVTAGTQQPSSSAQETTFDAKAALSGIVTTVVDIIEGSINDFFTLPHAPKYIPRETRIDFSSANLASYKYSPEGNFYYTDDKNCWQDNLGFSKMYDNLAFMAHMYYDTVRVPFEYDGKSWRIQIWKGQYGFYFVGSEIGVYTQDADDTGDHYVCAAKDDWLNMEMTLYWDSFRSGDYQPVLTRNYDKYWWMTGFVMGWEDKISDRSDLRLVARITFKDAEMANTFAAAFEEKGFKRVKSLGVTTLDSFLQVGRDVAFVWQNINLPE